MWLYLPPSCRSVPASADSILPSNESFQRLASSAMWRSKHSRPAFWRQRWNRGFLIPLRSGLTAAPLIADAGVASWISSLRDSRASRSVSPASSEGHKTRATCGPSCAGLSTGRGRLSSFWRTSQGSLLFDSLTGAPPMKSSDPSYNDWLTALRASSLRRRKLAHRTSGNGFTSSAWPTPSAHGSAGEDAEALVRTSGGKFHNSATGRVLQTNLATTVKHWPTPQATDDQRDRQSDQAVAIGSQREKASNELAVTARMWRSPTSRDWKGESAESWRNRETGDPTPTLADQVFQCGLLPPTNSTDGGAFSPSGPTLRPPSQWPTPQGKRRLNPKFVSWLMGFGPDFFE
jgi:hypothetical protein